MTLHEAIAQLLRQTRRPMTANEIADGLNKNKWYVKGDKSAIKANQIIARVDDHPELFVIDRSVFPLQIQLLYGQAKPANKTVVPKAENVTSKKTMQATELTQLITSFDPISNAETRILILGTMPGDKSLLQNEYYANSRNNFWKIIATLTSNVLPVTYHEKVNLLHSNHIGIWDVAHKANRKGSLDIAIEDEEPNDLDTFISKHKNLRVIGFNGTKSEALHDKYFTRKTNVKYLLLPSTSSANTSMNFDNMCKVWKQILTA